MNNNIESRLRMKWIPYRRIRNLFGFKKLTGGYFIDYNDDISSAITLQEVNESPNLIVRNNNLYQVNQIVTHQPSGNLVDIIERIKKINAVYTDISKLIDAANIVPETLAIIKELTHLTIEDVEILHGASDLTNFIYLVSILKNKHGDIFDSQIS